MTTHCLPGLVLVPYRLDFHCGLTPQRSHVSLLSTSEPLSLPVETNSKNVTPESHLIFAFPGSVFPQAHVQTCPVTNSSVTVLRETSFSGTSSDGMISELGGGLDQSHALHCYVPFYPFCWFLSGGVFGCNGLPAPSLWYRWKAVSSIGVMDFHV